MATSALLTAALNRHKAGQLEAAELGYAQVLQADADNFDAWYLSGILARRSGRFDSAVYRLGRAVELRPELPDAHCSLGLAWHCLNKCDEAIASYLNSLKLDPQNSAACFYLGNALRAVGKKEEAIISYRKALRLKPDFADAHNNLGNVFRSIGRFDDAIESLNIARELRPESAEVHCNLGHAYREDGNIAEAITAYQRSIELKPDLVAGYLGLGTSYQDAAETDNALACFNKALALQPGDSVALCSIGNILKEHARTAEALATFRQAIDKNSDLDCAQSNLLYTTYFLPAYDSDEIYNEHQLWNARRANSLPKTVQPHTNEASPERKLRVGYVSPNFCNHCQSFFTLPLFASHDYCAVEIFCYSATQRPDHRTAELQRHVNNWRNIVALDDEQAAELVRRDRIDILVDLTMHMAENRWRLFARRPVPVQVCWLAYPGTTGLSAIDYRISDPYLDPPGKFDSAYAERTVRLPNTFWCYDPLCDDLTANSLPALNHRYLTFGSLNNFCKVNDIVLNLWARVLKAIHGSRLIMLAADGYQRQHVLELMATCGVTSSRIEFLGRMPREEYLATFHKLDVVLDTVPYNGHTTTLDALWMGVPVVTLVGDTVVGRGGLSILSNLGLPQLVASDANSFVRIACSLADDLSFLSQIRATLRDRMQKSPLMDARRFAQNMENAYRGMWRSWCAAKKSWTVRTHNLIQSASETSEITPRL